MDLTYSYARGNSKGTLNGTTGQLTKIVNNLNRNKDRVYEFDSLGRLIKAKGGVAAGGSGVANWTQDYSFDRYGNKLTTTKTGITADSQAIPLDGIASQTFDATSNRINTAGYEYDKAGNLIRGKAPDGSWQRFEYDSAGRLVKIKTDAGTILEEYTYGASRERLRKEANSQRTYYAWGGSSVLLEYFETGTVPVWLKSYIYAGSRLLSTITNTSGNQVTEYHHPDRLGTRLISNPLTATQSEQLTLPFGTLIGAETSATNDKRFTSYDRSEIAGGLDYAVNRNYNSGQSRFTQVDPIGMASASISDPQSLNMFAYVQNNSIDFVDPSGLNDDPTEVVGVVNTWTFDWSSWYRFWLYSMMFNQGGGRGGGSIGGEPGGGRGGGGEPGGGSGRSADGQSNTQPAGLSDCAKKLLQKFFPKLDLSTINLVLGLPGWAPSKTTSDLPVAGITVGNTIYTTYQSNFESAFGATWGGLEFLAHEITHSDQYRRLGIIGFGIAYAVEGFFQGMIASASRAVAATYDANALETRAESNASRIIRQLKRAGATPCPIDVGNIATVTVNE